MNEIGSHEERFGTSDASAPRASLNSDVSVARLEGEIDIANEKKIAREILESMTSDAIGLVIDLSGVRYIDSSGIRMIFELARTLTAGRRHLALSVPESSPLRRLFTVTQIELAAPLEATIDDARSAVKRLANAGGV